MELQATSTLLVVRGGHLHKECPEKENTSSTPICCNCRLAEGEKPHPANYRGCGHAKERGDAVTEVAEDTQDYNGKGVLF
jgi:hypothetical protein